MRVAADIEQRVERQMIGVRASVSMGDTFDSRVRHGRGKRPVVTPSAGLARSPRRFTRRGPEAVRLAARHPAETRRCRHRRLDLYDLLLRAIPPMTPNCSRAT